MAVVARRLAGNPLAAAVVQRGAAVERGGHLDTHPGQAARHPIDKADVELACFFFEQAATHVHAGFAQPLQATAGNRRVRVFHGRHHARDAGAHQRVRAGRRPAKMAAGLERDKGRGTLGIVPARRGILERLDLGVILPGGLGEALADDLAVLGQNAANARVGRGGVHATLGERESLCHGCVVGIGEHEAWCFLPRGR